MTAAVEMVRELGELNRKWAAEGRVQLDIGIGINSGDMIAGNIGSSAIMSYTVIGDNVNLGARLESLNKEYRTRIIISEATRGRLARTVRDPPARRRRRQGKDAAGRDFRGRRAVAPGCVGRGGEGGAGGAGNRRKEQRDTYEKACIDTRLLAIAVLAIARRPATAQLGGISGALKKARDRQEDRGSQGDRRRGTADRSARSATRSSRSSASIRTRRSRST